MLPDDASGKKGQSGLDPTSTNPIFVITRLGYRTPIHLFLSYLRYRRMVGRAKSLPGLLTTSFLVESARTCYMLSTWRDMHSIAVFGTAIEDHPHAVREAIGRLRWAKDGPETWSAKLSPISFHERLGKPVDPAIGARQ